MKGKGRMRTFWVDSDPLEPAPASCAAFSHFSHSAASLCANGSRLCNGGLAPRSPGPPTDRDHDPEPTPAEEPAAGRSEAGPEPAPPSH